VSRVLNGEAYFSEESAAKVRTAAAQLGFRVNVMARELRSGAASRTVGLLIGDLANPFWSGVARGVERELSARGLRLLTASTEEDAALEGSLTQDMLDRRVSALLIVPSAGAAGHRYLEVERRQRLPVVFIDRPPSDLVADTVLLDNAGGACLAAGPRPHLWARRVPRARGAVTDAS
jgi:LacI family transcriptional regulator